MGRIVIPRVRQEARQQLQRKRRTGYFANGFGPQEMKLVMQLADLAVAGGGQIARAVQISNREKEQAEAQADYDRGIQADIESRQKAAQAEIDEAQMASGPQAFAASFFADQPGVAPVSVKEQLIRDASAFRGATQTRGAPIVATGGMAPEDIQRFAVGQRPKTPTQLPGYGVSTGRYMPHETMPGLIEPPGAPTAAMTRADVLRAAQEGRGLEWAEGNTLYDEALARASQAAGPMPPDGDSVYYTAAGDPTSTPHYGPMPMQLTRPAGFEEARLAAQQRDFRQEAIEAAGPAPERKLFRIADILAAAPSARTAEQRAMLLQAASDSPDIQAANLSDLAKGAYRDRAMQAVMKLFPEEEEPMSELDKLRAEYLRQQTLTSKSLQDERNARIKAAQDKADKDALRKVRTVSGRSPDDQRVFDSLMNHRRDFQSFQEGTGRYSATNIATSLSRRFGENRQYTPEEIQTVREQIWSSRTGPLSGSTDADREDLAMGMFSTRRSGKKFGGIVKGIKSSDKKAIDQALKGSKEERIAEGQDVRIKQAENRLSIQLKRANQLTPAQRELARIRAASKVGTKDAEAYYDAWSRELQSMMGGAEYVAPAGEAPRDNPIVVKDEVIDIDN